MNQLNQQFDYIVSKQTNAELTSTIKNTHVKRLLDKNNELIKKNKEYYMSQRHKEQELHELLTNLTHDLKTPLTVSTGYIQMLLKEEDQSEKRAELQKVAISLDAIKHYLNYLMEYNLIQEKNISLKLEKIELSELLKENLFSYFELFKTKQLDCTFDIDDNIAFVSDYTIIQRILQNTLGNMSKYAYDACHITLKQQPETIHLTFKNGLKEPIKNQEDLFQRFTTEDLSRTNKSTGLGLHIVQELCELIHCRPELVITEDSFELSFTFKKQNER